MLEPVELEKEYTTRNGRPVRLLSLDAGGPFPVVGLIQSGRHWTVGRWSIGGEYKKGSSGHWDLIPLRRRVSRTFWVNVTKDGYDPVVYQLQDEAHFNAYGLSARLACVKVTVECEEGEGMTPAAVAPDLPEETLYDIHYE